MVCYNNTKYTGIRILQVGYILINSGGDLSTAEWSARAKLQMEDSMTETISKRIAILGGTFDPVHLGHLIIADEIFEEFRLDSVIFIPSGIPPHKRDRSVTEAHHRYYMLSHAIASNPKFKISQIELERRGYTYTIDTLIQLKESYGEKSELFFITGADVIHDLLTWKDYTSVFSMCEFIAVFRPGFNKQSFFEEIEYLRKEYNVKIHIAESLLIDLSSTAIRERIRLKKSIKYLVPEEIEKYIFENNLYK